jgi:formate dehydrogenase maturation protein FdhE
VGNPAVAEGVVETAFEKRAARAELLAGESVTAAEPLRFASGLYRVQGRLATAIESLHAERPLSGRLDEDADRFLDHCGSLLRFASEHGPPALVEAAREREDAAHARSRLLGWWIGDRETGEDYLSRALLRPYVEVLARLRVAPDRLHRPGHCPFCGGSPWIAARRVDADGGSAETGARRLLGCALCGREWPVGRILCPACEEGDPAKLPSFQSASYPAVRIEACETCHRYVKSIDLTKDTRAIPEVDDLVSLGMDLWAANEGFARIEPGLAGV